MAVLDGQQRLTSLYIALKGNYANKIAYKKWDNPEAYPKKKLYLNLFGNSEDISYKYEFKFLTDTECKENNDDYHWFEVGKIMDLKELNDVNNYLIEALIQIKKNQALQVKHCLNYSQLYM